MLPARARLRREAELHTVTRRGVRARRDDLTVHLLSTSAFVREHPALAGSAARAAVVVGRAVGGATVRNRLRRRVRHGLADVWGQLPDGSQLVVRAGPGVGRLDSAQLRSALGAALTLAAARGAGQNSRRGAPS